ncbi:MAG: FliM/FliN family flagellar motor C-terminal domain-containing protein [Pseudomonadota bacterium]
MTGVLRKKLESSGGLPPSVLQNQVFWVSLETVLANWMNKTLGGENELRLQSREVCRGTALSEDLFGAYLYGFQSDVPDFILGVSIDNLIAARIAGEKLQQSPDSLMEAPQLFLQLLIEPHAGEIAQDVATTFEALNAEGEGPETVPFDSMEVEGSCLLVYYICDIEGQAVRLGVALKLDRVIAFAAANKDGLASADGSNDSSTATIQTPRVQNSKLKLNVIIDRVPMSIADCARLEPGTVISLPGTDRAKLTISARTVDGPVDIATGELGVWKHQRAVRLKTEIEPSFLQEVTAA